MFLNTFESDNGPEFIAKALQSWFAKLGIETLYIEPGSPWENGYCESFNSRFRDEFLAIEEFENLAAAKALTRIYRANYKQRSSAQLAGLHDSCRFRPAVFRFSR